MACHTINTISVSRIRQVLNYNPDTGIFIWKERHEESAKRGRWNSRNAGKKAGTIDSYGYLRLVVDYRQIMGHVAAWMIFYGEHPNGLIDHRNRNPADNRIENLRKSSASLNQQNTSLSSRNTSGFTGVFWCPLGRKWRARIGLATGPINLGSYQKVEDAAEAVDSWKRQNWPHYTA